MHGCGRRSGNLPTAGDPRPGGPSRQKARSGWLFTPDELQLEGLEMEEAIGVARGLVDVATAGRFRSATLAVSPDLPPHSPRVQHQTRPERTEQ
jgi:hypothetical protein